MSSSTLKNIAIAALVGQASAFSVLHATGLQHRTHAQAICAPAHRERHSGMLSLRATANDAQAQMEQNPMAMAVDEETIVIDPAGFSAIDVKGEYIEDGWVDESAVSSGPGLLGGLFGGLFGGEKEVANGMTRAQLASEMDKIEFLDGSTGSLTEAVRTGTAVPFGGLNPAQIEAWKEANGGKEYDPSQISLMGGKDAPLPDGWYSATDEVSGSEYYYTAEGDVSWERPAAE